MPNNIAILYEGIGANAERDRIFISGENGSLSIIPVGDIGQVEAVARALVNETIMSVQLCGGTPARTRAEVAAALSERCVVSAVTFGIESLDRASEYGAAFAKGTPPPEAFIILMPGWETKIWSKSYPPQDTRFVIVGDDMAAAQMAGELAAEGVGLIELYGLVSSRTAAMVIEVVAGRAAVGVIGCDVPASGLVPPLGGDVSKASC